jgi:hypothetical protein
MQAPRIAAQSDSAEPDLQTTAVAKSAMQAAATRRLHMI